MGAAPIGKGDWVECIDASPCAFYGPPDLTVGAVYQVERLEVGTQNIDRAAVWLVGRRSRGENGGYGLGRFRPIYRRDETLTARLLSDIPADAPASPEEVVA